MNSPNWFILKIPVSSINEDIQYWISSFKKEYNEDEGSIRIVSVFEFDIMDLDLFCKLLKRKEVPFDLFLRLDGGPIMRRTFRFPDIDVEFSLTETMRPIIRLDKMSRMHEEHSLESNIQRIMLALNRLTSLERYLQCRGI